MKPKTLTSSKVANRFMRWKNIWKIQNIEIEKKYQLALQRFNMKFEVCVDNQGLAVSIGKREKRDDERQRCQYFDKPAEERVL